MKSSSVLQVLLILALLALSYVVWIQGQQLVELTLDVDNLRLAASKPKPAPKPRPARKPAAPKETK